jgi:probable DNA metabolism protein
MSRAPVARGSWAYEGSLESLFLLADRALGSGEYPESLGGSGARPPSLFDAAPIPVEAPDPAEAESAACRLRAFSGELFDLCLRAWMSEEGVEPELLATAAAAGLEGPDSIEDFARPQVRVLQGACRRVDREIHRLQGLARFSPRNDGLYSAPLEPDHNVIAALSPHFARRFGPQPFALVDLRRSLAFESREGRLRALAGREALELLPDRAEDEDIELWRRYFEAAENPARRNPALQRRLMPSRYWKYLPELLH